jgi:hypothetical protein
MSDDMTIPKPRLTQKITKGEPLRPMLLSSQDIALWYRWHKIFGEFYDAFYFNVLLGQPPIPSEYWDVELEEFIYQSYSLRPDVVGEKKDFWEIFEIRPNAGPGAIGSVLTYATLWEANPPDERPLKKSLITDAADINLRYVADRFGITIYVV